MTKVAVTGFTGFVGTNLLAYIRDHGSEAIGIDLRNSTNTSVLNFNGFDAIVHLAGKAHDLKKSIDNEEYYRVNTELTIQVFEAFLLSNAKTFIFLSSVKAIADVVEGILTEDAIPNPVTHYGKSKLLAEQFIEQYISTSDRKIYVLRPSMIHGPGNKGNLNLLYNLVKLGLPYPLGSFNNKRSFLSIENLCFVIVALIRSNNVPSDYYNICDNEPLSTNEIVTLIGRGINKESRIIRLPKRLVYFIAKMGDAFRLPLTTERLAKLTENYIIDNSRLMKFLQEKLPVTSSDGIVRTVKNLAR